MKEIKLSGNDVIGPGTVTVYVAIGGGAVVAPIGLHFESEDGQVKHQGFNLSIGEARRLAAFLVLNT